jgi:serine/threonine-protein kinase
MADGSPHEAYPDPLNLGYGRGVTAGSSRPLGPGDVVDGKYLLVSEVGSGSHGQVYSARELETERACAVKLLNANTASDDQFVYRLWREARSLEALWGTSVVEIYGFGQDPSGASYLVMELLRGQTLAEHLADLELFDDRMR